MPTKNAHQAIPERTVVESGSPPPVAVPGRMSIDQPEPRRLRGLADARHPSEDGKPMAWSLCQGRAMVDAEYPIRFRYESRDDVFVSIDLLVYYSEGPWPKSVVPNVFVSFGVPSYPREVYRIEEEGKPPDWVLEVASPKTFRYNVGGKKDLYEEIGVGEYWVYDPHGDLHDPRLRGWVLGPAGYRELVDLRRPGVPVALWSEALGLELHFDGSDLRAWDPAIPGYLPRIREETRAREAAERRADDERRHAETEARAREAAERRGDIAEAKLEVESQARQAAEQRAETEARARREKDARIAALEDELQRLRNQR